MRDTAALRITNGYIFQSMSIIHVICFALLQNICFILYFVKLCMFKINAHLITCIFTNTHTQTVLYHLNHFYCQPLHCNFFFYRLGMYSYSTLYQLGYCYTFSKRVQYIDKVINVGIVRVYRFCVYFESRDDRIC